MLNAGSLLYRYFRFKEKKLYALSDHIGCLSEANVRFLLRHNSFLNPKVIEVCPNSIEPLTVEKNADLVREIRLKYDIPLDKTVFIYGGNFGKPQGIDFIIKCLQSNESRTQAFFLLIGSGTEFNKLQKYFAEAKPKNALLLHELPKSDYDLLAQSSDVGLIFLDRRFTVPNFPSRLLSYMQATIAVLAATDVNTDIGKIIEFGEFGFWCESGNLSEFDHQVGKFNDLEGRKQMGINARNYLESHYTVKHTYEIIMKHFN